MTTSATLDDAPPDAHNPAPQRPYYLNNVMDLARRTRTRELPGNYPFTVKEMLIVEAVSTWRRLATKCFEDVQKILTTHLIGLINDNFGKLASGGLRDTVTAIARKRIQNRFLATIEKINSLCASEETPYTQNEHYFFSFRSKLLGRYKAIYRQSRGQQGVVTLLRAYNPPHNNNSHVANALSYLANLGISGIVAEDLAKLLPDDEMAPALEIMAEVRAYFQVAFKRFGDNIPKQIDMDFVRGTDQDLDLALRAIDLSEEQCMEWLQESRNIVEKRNELLAKKRRLESAQQKLASVRRSSTFRV